MPRASRHHKHKPQFVMGQHPVAAKCECGMKLIANGGGWVSAEEAAKRQKAIGFRGAL
jgi:hypothetical protein